MAIVINKARPHIPPEQHIFSKMELAGSGKLVNVVPNNTVNFAVPLKAIIAETAGDIACVNADGSVTIVTAVAGQTIPGVVYRINATGTTATGITGVA